MSNPFHEDTTPQQNHNAGRQNFPANSNQDFFTNSSPFQDEFGSQHNRGEDQPQWEEQAAWDNSSEWDEQAGWENPSQWDEQSTWGNSAGDVNAYAYPTPPQKRSWRWLLILAGILFFLIVTAISGGAGYFSGIQSRVEAESSQIQGSLQEQYDLAMQDIEQSRYHIAKQRLEYILTHDPNFPEASKKLTDVQIAINLAMNVPNVTQAVLSQFTATPSPTPDIRGAEEIFRSAQTALTGKDWSSAIDLLLRLRKNYPDFNSVRVDGLLYVAYRNRGIDKILREAQLEGGTYDFALAERYGPLDAEAQNYRDWVNLYVVGASFWDLNWAEAANYFGQLAPLAPQLRDASGWSASQRYQIALVNYADQLINAGEYCPAEEQYNLAVQSGRSDIQPTAQAAHLLCSPPTEPAPASTPSP